MANKKITGIYEETSSIANIASNINNNNKVLLEETFYVLSKKNCVFRVQLTGNTLNLLKESNNVVKKQEIFIGDIIGCEIWRSRKKKMSRISRVSSSCVCHSLPKLTGIGNSNGNETNSEINTATQDDQETEEDDEFEETDTSSYLHIYAYVMKQNTRRRNRRCREKTIITLRFRSFDKYEDNNRESHRWRTLLKQLINCTQLKLTQNIDHNYDLYRNRAQKLIIFLNPKSGAGKARLLFQKNVVPILQQAEIPYDLHVTKYANYAKQLVKNSDSNIFTWKGIVAIGGDGILFEIVNGILERNDWKEILQRIPVGIIPCGSGNGLSRALFHYVQEPFGPNPVLAAALAVVKQKTIKMDLMKVQTKSKTFYSFLSVGFGLISDIDIESERLRAFGGQRFTLWSVARLLSLRTYKAKLWYLPATTVTTATTATNQNKPHSKYDHDYILSSDDDVDDFNTLPLYQQQHQHHHYHQHNYHLQQQQQRIRNDNNNINVNDSGDEDMNCSIMNSPSSLRGRLDSFYSTASSHQTAYFSMQSEKQTVDDNSINNSIVSDFAATTATFDNNGIGSTSASASASASANATVTTATANISDNYIATNTITKSSMNDIDSKWCQMHGEFILIHATKQTHLGEECLIAKQAKPNDGLIWLVIIKAGATRSQVLTFLLTLNQQHNNYNTRNNSCHENTTIPITSTQHTTNPSNNNVVQIIPVKAFRLEPDQNHAHHAHLTVDGELIDYGPVHVEIFTRLLHVMIP